MSLTSLYNSLKQLFGSSNPPAGTLIPLTGPSSTTFSPPAAGGPSPQALPDMLNKISFGDFLRASKTYLRRKAPLVGATNGSNANQLTTLQVIPTGDDAKAATILRAYAISTSAAGTLGELAVQAFGATPADGQIAVAPNGDIVVLAASAYTSVDVVYEPEKQDVVEMLLPVVAATGVCALPTTNAAIARGVISLLEAEILTTSGAVTPAKKHILVPAAGAPATLQARLDVAKANVQFNQATDLPTGFVRVKLGVVPSVDVDALLESAQTQYS